MDSWNEFFPDPKLILPPSFMVSFSSSFPANYQTNENITISTEEKIPITTCMKNSCSFSHGICMNDDY